MLFGFVDSLGVPGSPNGAGWSCLADDILVVARLLSGGATQDRSWFPKPADHRGRSREYSVL